MRFFVYWWRNAEPNLRPIAELNAVFARKLPGERCEQAAPERTKAIC